MNIFVKSFFNGLLIFVPVAITAYVIWFIVGLLDGWLDVPIPGLGVVVSLVFITLLGFLASNVFGKRIVGFMEATLKRLPIVRIIYTSLKDLIHAFVGEKKSFDKPVMVDILPDKGIKVFGFVTCSSFDDAKLHDHVSVYLPQSYNFAGNLIIVPRDRIQSVDADGAQFMAFIVSGGVATMSAAKTSLDLQGLSALKRN